MAKVRTIAYEAARAVWPSIAVEYDVFCEHLERLGWTDSAPPQCDSLYLCLACARGDNTACTELERRYLKTLRSTLARVVRSPDLVEETLQVVRARLLTGSQPRIATYKGSGPLETWLRVVATRIALDELRARKRAARNESNLAHHYELETRHEPSVESELFRHVHGPAIQRALRRGLAGLDQEDRRVLRLSLIQGLSIDALAELFQVHRSNAARRVQRSRQRAFRAVQEQLKSELGELSEADFSQLVGTLYNNAEAGLSALQATIGPLDRSSIEAAMGRDSDPGSQSDS